MHEQFLDRWSNQCNLHYSFIGAFLEKVNAFPVGAPDTLKKKGVSPEKRAERTSFAIFSSILHVKMTHFLMKKGCSNLLHPWIRHCWSPFLGEPRLLRTFVSMRVCIFCYFMFFIVSLFSLLSFIPW